MGIWYTHSIIDGHICKYFMGKNRHQGTEDPVNIFNQLETTENKTMIKVTTIFLASLVVVVLAGTSHAQLFIEDFDTYTGWSGGEETPAASRDGLATNGWVKAQISGQRRSVGAIRNKGIGGSQAGGQTFDIESYFGAAGRDVTGEVNPNGNYMVRSLINPGVSVDGV